MFGDWPATPHERLKATEDYIKRTQKHASKPTVFGESYIGGMTLYAKYFVDELPGNALLACHHRAGHGAVSALLTNAGREIWKNCLNFLGAVPIDSFSGQPLRFTQKGATFVVYSIGENRVDDGGTVGGTGRNRGPDLGFVLHDPTQRRQPGPPFVFPERDGNEMKASEPQPGWK